MSIRYNNYQLTGRDNVYLHINYTDFSTLPLDFCKQKSAVCVFRDGYVWQECVDFQKP